MKSEEWAAAEPPLTEKEERPAAEPPGTVAGSETDRGGASVYGEGWMQEGKPRA